MVSLGISPYIINIGHESRLSMFVCLYTLFEFANPNEHKCSMTRQRICYYVTGKEGWGENKEKKARMVDISMKSEALSNYK